MQFLNTCEVCRDLSFDFKKKLTRKNIINIAIVQCEVLFFAIVMTGCYQGEKKENILYVDPLIGIKNKAEFGMKKSKIDNMLNSNEEEEKEYNNHSGGKYYRSINSTLHFAGESPYKMFMISVHSTDMNGVYVKKGDKYDNFKFNYNENDICNFFKGFKILKNKNNIDIKDIGVSLYLEYGIIKRIDFLRPKT